jgi:hypothetical protein
MPLPFKPDFIARATAPDYEPNFYAVAGFYEGQTKEVFQHDWDWAIVQADKTMGHDWTLDDITHQLRDQGWKIEYIEPVEVVV